MNPFKPISISLSPNTEKDDIRLALKLFSSAFASTLLKLRRIRRSSLTASVGGQPWREGPAIKELEEEFKDYLGVKYAVSFNSGRSAFLAILKCLNLREGDEVLLQAFTCNAAANPILWAGFKPVYLDCDKRTFNIDVADLKRKITQRSRIVMVQHTFGLPADLDEILEICQKNNLILIEDCAHSLGAEYKGKKVGTLGKAAFLSFSRDKVISSVYGGMAVTNDDTLAKKIRDFQNEIGCPSYFWIFQQLLHPILMNYFILPTYSFFRLGKTALSCFQWFKILSKAVHWKEKRGKKPGYFPKRLPNALSKLALNQFKKLEKFNNHRKEIADFYYNELKGTNFELPPNPEDRKQIFLRFTIKHSEAHRLIKKAWSKNILIGDWYDKVIAPHDTKLGKMQYMPGSCPKAETLSKTTLNLPTHINISQKEAKIIVDFLKSYGD